MKQTIWWCIIFTLGIWMSLPLSAQLTNPRAWAEYEETAGLIINPAFRWGQKTFGLQSKIDELNQEADSLYVIIIKEALSQSVHVYLLNDTLNANPEFSTSMIDTLERKYGIDINDPCFHRVDYNGLKLSPSQWTRDHGPINVYQNLVDTLYQVLCRYSTTGAGKIISEYLNMPEIEISEVLGFESDGGNFMVDGNGNAFMDEGQTDKPRAFIDYAEVFGLKKVYQIPHFRVHIDYYMKLVNEETIILSEQLPQNYTSRMEDWDFHEENQFLAEALAYIQENALSKYGRPIKIIQIPNAPSYIDSHYLAYMTSEANYTNSLIMNNVVFVPQFKNSESDSLALQTYRNAMPGYKIIPVPARFGAETSGGIHCLTSNIASRDPVIIQHAWYPDTISQTYDYEISANILAAGGIKRATLWWTTGIEQGFKPITLSHILDDVYSGSIPGQQYGQRVWYYIEAETHSGKVARKPLVAPNWAYNFLVHSGGVRTGIINNVNLNYDISVYPNPARENITFDFREFETLDSTFEIFDLLGKRLAFLELSGPLVKLDISTYPFATYFYVIKNKHRDFLTGQFQKR